jgi:hypothetical protein
MTTEIKLPVQKRCGTCASIFTCGDSSYEKCWCNNYPAIFELDDRKDCLCQNCLHKATELKINAYVSKISREGTKNNTAQNIQNNSVLQGIDYYIENGLWVFTAWYHLKRGNCCGSNCRHCPYKTKLI